MFTVAIIHVITPIKRLKRSALTLTPAPTPNSSTSRSSQSGTVGQPKGVMISHDIFTWTAEHGSQCANFRDAQDSTVSYLPLCHGAAQIVDVYAALRAACTIYFAQPDALKVPGGGGAPCDIGLASCE